MHLAMSPTKIKRSRLLVGLLSLLLWPIAASAEISIEDPGMFVVDTADIIDDTVQVRLEGWLRELEQRTTAQVKVLTVETTGGEDFFSFVHRHATHWKLGQKGKDNGALIALAVKERRLRIHTGYGFQNVMPDSWARSISRDVAAQYFAKGRYSDGLYWLAIAVANKVADAENAQLSGIPDYRYRGAEPPYAAWEKHLDAAGKAYQQGRYADAERSFQDALKEAETFGAHDLRLAVSLKNLARLYQAQGRYAQAEPLYKRAVAIYEQALGPEHPHGAVSLHNLAEVYRLQGRYAEAEPLYKRALAMAERALGSEHLHVAFALDSLAGLYQAQGEYTAAEPLLKRALAIFEKASGPEHPDVAQSLENYADLLRKTNRAAEAGEMEARAKAIRAKHAQEN